MIDISKVVIINKLWNRTVCYYSMHVDFVSLIESVKT